MGNYYGENYVLLNAPILGRLQNTNYAEQKFGRFYEGHNNLLKSI